MRMLFTSGTARGGTNFRTLLLSGHPAVAMSIDPFIPLFRCYRDALLKAAGISHPASGVLDDYYYDQSKREVMKAVQNTDPDVPFDPSEWEGLRAALASRMKLGSMNLIPRLDQLEGATFREVFHSAMELVASVKAGDVVWAGFNDNWAMEFFRPLARLMPEAKFMLHLRDPRAVVASSEFAEPDARKRPTVLSFARHLRKYHAFAHVLQQDALLRDRLCVTYYEPFLEDLEGQTRRMTDFLGLDFRPEMIDIARFRKADGTPWPSDWAIYRTSGDGWRKEMPQEMIELVEFVCSREMALHGYRREVYDPASGLTPETLRYALTNARECLHIRASGNNKTRSVSLRVKDAL